MHLFSLKKIQFESAGHYFEGLTDKNGQTQRIYTLEPVVFTVRKNNKILDGNNSTRPRTERFDAEY